MDLSVKIKSKLYDFRGTKVMLDSDLAEYYGIATKNLNRAVKRNTHLFPDDFMFQLTDEETAALRFQTGTSSRQGGNRYNPYVFSEKEAWTVSFILNSKEVSEKGVQLIRVLEKLKDFALQHQSSLPATTAYQITSPSSVVNIYNSGTIQLQQGSHNIQNINLKDVVFNLQEIKEKSSNENFNEKLDVLISALMKKEEKSKVLTAMEAVIAVAKGTKTVVELGKLVTAAVSAYLGLGL